MAVDPPAAPKPPDLPRERIGRIARLRDEIRRGTLETEERLGVAIARAVAAAERGGSRL